MIPRVPHGDKHHPTSFYCSRLVRADPSKEEWWAMLIVGKRKLLRPPIRAYLIGHYKTQTPSLIDRWIIINHKSSRVHSMNLALLYPRKLNWASSFRFRLVQLRMNDPPRKFWNVTGSLGLKVAQKLLGCMLPAHGSEQKLLDLQFHLRQTVTVYHANKHFFSDQRRVFECCFISCVLC